MDTDSIFTVVIMAFLVLCSAYFSATETAFSSLNRIRIKNMAESGNSRADLVLTLSERFDDLLSAILIGNNIVNISLTSIATVFFVNHFGDMGATLSTVIITIVVLIFGEVSPKSMAKESPESFAMFSAPLLRIIVVLLTPVNFLFSQWKKLISKLFKVNSKNVITDDELLTIVDEAQSDGGINEEEGELIKSAIEFNDLTADDIFTPRVDVVAIDKTEDISKISEIFVETGFSRLPVFDGSIDNIIGILHLKDFYNEVYHRDKTVEQVMKEPLFITGSMTAGSLLSKLQAEKSHIAIIADEYGGTEGIVTMEDLLEELVGDIWDEHDRVTKDIEKTGDNCYRVVCSTNFEEFAEYFEISSESDCSTVGGWVMENLGKVATVGDMFEYENLTILVTRTEDHRIMEIIVKIKKLKLDEE